jgi:hypothetical protein
MRPLRPCAVRVPPPSADDHGMDPVSAALSLNVQALVMRDVREQTATVASPQVQAAAPADVILTLSAAAQRLSAL